MRDKKFSLYDIEQFIREAGAEKVTEDAVLNLERELEKLAEKITKNAIRYAQHAGRKKLIRRADVLFTDSRVQNIDYNRRKNLRPNASRTDSSSITIK